MIFNKVVYVAAPKVQLAAPSDLIATPGTGKISLTWTDPEDIVRTGKTVATWAKTRIVRKEGAPPNDHNDGVIVVESTEKNQYQSTPYDDSTVQVGTVYHYGAFSYSEEGVWSEGAFVNATPMAGTPLGSLAEGTLIKILENGAPVEFYVAMQNYEAGLNGTGRVLCVRRPAHLQRQWTIYSGNDYNGSSIDSWLNSTYVGYFSENVTQMMGSTTIYYGVGTQGYQMTRSCFIMSTLELGYPGHVSMGSTLPIASVLQGSYSTDPSSYQWTRTPASSDGMAWAASKNYGAVGVDCQNRYWIVPCFTLPATALVDQDLNLIEEVSA